MKEIYSPSFSFASSAASSSLRTSSASALARNATAEGLASRRANSCTSSSSLREETKEEDVSIA